MFSLKDTSIGNKEVEGRKQLEECEKGKRKMNYFYKHFHPFIWNFLSQMQATQGEVGL